MPSGHDDFPDPERDLDETGEQTLVVAGGCFWCTEAVCKPLEGVLEATSSAQKPLHCQLLVSRSQ